MAGDWSLKGMRNLLLDQGLWQFNGGAALGSHLAACGKTEHAIKVCGKALGD